MSRALSLTMRHALYAQESGEVVVFLVTISHPDLAEPVRLSTDPTVRLSDEPLAYGTISNGETYLFAAAQLVVPNDQPGQPPAGQLIFEDVEADAVAIIRSITDEPAIRMQGVLASAPDYVEIEWGGLLVREAPYEEGQVTLAFSRESRLSQPWPCDRITRARFPGAFP